MKQIDILVFRTSIRNRQDAKRAAAVLNTYPQIKQWNVDFEDWEKVLRIECEKVDPAEISKMLRSVDIWVSELE